MGTKPKKYSLFMEALRINIFNVLAIAFLWALIDSVDFFNPFGDILEDFDYTDLYYSEFKSSQLPTDTNIFIVNIGSLSRMELALMINTLQKFEPKVIGIDAVFFEKKGAEDLFLRQALNQKDNIVLGVMGKYKGEEAIGITQSHPFFGEHTIGHLEFRLKTGTPREYEKYITYNDTVVYSFTSEIIRKYDSVMFEKYHSRKSRIELINYRGGEVPFIEFDFEQVTDSNPNMELIRGKIVLLGYLRQFMGAPFDLDDSFYTPLKKSEFGFPDTKGIEIHAHILSMIMQDRYVTLIPKWANYLLAFLITQLLLMLFVYLYVHKSRYFDFISKPTQFIAIAILLWATFMVFKELKIKIDILPTALALILSIEVLYLYEEALELLKINTYLTQNFKFERNGKKSKKKSKNADTHSDTLPDSESNDSSEHRV